MTERYAAVDVHYPPAGGAVAAAVVAADQRYTSIVDERVAWLAEVPPYRPGAFFERELPALRAVLVAAAPVYLVIPARRHADPHRADPGIVSPPPT